LIGLLVAFGALYRVCG